MLDLKDFLAEEGYQVHALTDPDAVVEEIKQGRYQMVMFDVSPPADPSILSRNRVSGEVVSSVSVKDLTSPWTNVRTTSFRFAG